MKQADSPEFVEREESDLGIINPLPRCFTSFSMTILNSTFRAAENGEIIQIVINIPTRIERLLVLPVLLYRRIRYGYAFRRIPLTQGMFAIVDPDDYWRLSRHKWCALKDQSTFYAIRWIYQGKNQKRQTVSMHREIVKAGDDQLCDHINHKRLDRECRYSSMCV